jgi:hypothetical protein
MAVPTAIEGACCDPGKSATVTPQYDCLAHCCDDRWDPPIDNRTLPPSNQGSGRPRPVAMANALGDVRGEPSTVAGSHGTETGLTVRPRFPRL